MSNLYGGKPSASLRVSGNATSTFVPLAAITGLTECEPAPPGGIRPSTRTSVASHVSPKSSERLKSMSQYSGSTLSLRLSYQTTYAFEPCTAIFGSRDQPSVVGPESRRMSFAVRNVVPSSCERLTYTPTPPSRHSSHVAMIVLPVYATAESAEIDQ